VLKLNLIVLILISIWAGLMWVTPYMAEEGTLRDLDGIVGYRDHNETFEDLPGVARWMYRSGDSQCHQRDSRTIILNGNEMPFCARDVAIYTLMAIGLAITVFPRMPYHDRITDIKWPWIVVGLVPIGIDGTGQLLDFWESTNPLRFLTGGLCGFVVGIALGFMLREANDVTKDIFRDLRMWRAESKGVAPPQESGDEVGPVDVVDDED
jgi:uncharacterized membrane protein